MYGSDKFDKEGCKCPIIGDGLKRGFNHLIEFVKNCNMYIILIFLLFFVIPKSTGEHCNNVYLMGQNTPIEILKLMLYERLI